MDQHDEKVDFEEKLRLCNFFNLSHFLDCQNVHKAFEDRNIEEMKLKQVNAKLNRLKKSTGMKQIHHFKQLLSYQESLGKEEEGKYYT
jgi:hypothetical protein